MRFLLTFLILLQSSLAFTQNKNVVIGPEPEWIEPISYNKQADSDDGPVLNLLSDEQVNFETQEFYKHIALKLLTHEGVQQNSDLSFYFDPSFQSFRIHQVRVIREGKVLDKLAGNEFRVLENESRMDRYLYDGSVTAVLNLRDIRKGDILEYSYTISGKNEAFPSHDFAVHYLQYYNPLEKLHLRVIEHPERPLHLVLKNGAETPLKKAYKGNQTEWVWSKKDIQALIPDQNVPSWYDPFPLIELSSYKNWADVVNATMPLYTVGAEDIHRLLREIKGVEEADGEWEQLHAITDFIQNEVRYLGFEDGRNAFKPHRPQEVMKQRFGDCKDKSLLMVALCQAIGIEAYPMLVNTNMAAEVENYTCSPFQFNHCVVAIRHHERDYFVDPTISYAGGEILNRNFPAYKKGLIIKLGETQLTDLYANDAGIVKITQEVEIPEDSSGVGKFVVTSEYSGVEADYIRSYFSANTRASIEQEYLSYYSSIYPKLKLAQTLTFDDQRDNNKFTTVETYHVPEIWQYQKELGYYTAEAYSLVMENYAYIDKSSSRTMPMAIPGPVNVYTETSIKLPSEWNVETDATQIDREKYSYSYRSFYNENENTILINQRYRLKDSYLEAKDYDQYLADHELIQANLGFTLNQDFGSVTAAGAKAPWLLLLLVVGIGVGCFKFFRRVWKNYNPAPPRWVKESRRINGWLILIALHLILSPVRLIVQLFSEEYFSGELWNNLLFSSLEVLDMQTRLIIIVTFVVNLLILATQIFLNFAFFKRRSFFPNVFSIYFLGLILVHLADTLVLNWMEGNSFYTEMGSVLGLLLFGAIMVPALLVSERANETFTETYQKPEEINTPEIQTTISA